MGESSKGRSGIGRGSSGYLRVKNCLLRRFQFYVLSFFLSV